MYWPGMRVATRLASFVRIDFASLVCPVRSDLGVVGALPEVECVLAQVSLDPHLDEIFLGSALGRVDGEGVERGLHLVDFEGGGALAIGGFVVHGGEGFEPVVEVEGGGAVDAVPEVVRAVEEGGFGLFPAGEGAVFGEEGCEGVIAVGVVGGSKGR